MNAYLAVILFFVIGGYVLELIVEKLNLGRLSTDLPGEFDGFYDRERYGKSQEYLRDKTAFALFQGFIMTAFTVIFILAAGFNFVDGMARSAGMGEIPTGLIFAGILLLCTEIVSIPFSCYNTFVIEEKYGFNRTTVPTFVLDILKKWLLSAIIGGIIFSFILWFFDMAGALGWVYCWVVVVLFELFLTFVAPVIILPIFNKFIPLEEGELKRAIEDYAKSENFKMSGLFKMDASKRSSKSNAFFIGFGKFRRIVLFDTLIEKHTVDELVSVLAHEMGHYRKKHILKMMVLSVMTSGLIFYIMSLFINNAGLFGAFRMDYVSVYASIFFFSFLYTPINMAISVLGNVLSRKYEYEADAYTNMTFRKPEAMISALKKLSVDNLSNLTPHPLKVFLQYSHPPVLERIRAIRRSP